MPEQYYEYAIPEGLDGEAIQSALQDAMRFKEESSETRYRTYYDSFDWRLFEQGSTLEKETGEGLSRLNWRALSSGECYGLQGLEQPPHFVWDLPPGALRSRLEPILEMRALLPQAKVRSTIQAMGLLNKEQKTLLRLVIEQNQVVNSDGKATQSLDRVRILPIKGYPKALRKTRLLLEEKLGLEPATDDLMLKALAALGRQPGDYSSKLNLQLDPSMRADAAAKRILLHLLDTMERNESGTRADLDSEFLHDFRVAVRRSRSALSQIKDVFSQRTLGRFQPKLAWLGQITGPTRDLDVYLLNFDTYRATLPAAVRGDLDPLLRFLRAHQRLEQQSFVKGLDSPRYAQFVAAWRAFLEQPVPAHSRLPNAARPVSGVANERIWRVYRRTLKEGRAIGPETPAEALHELRKTCKKLRYLMEFFQSLYPKAEIRQLVKALKNLQENLGDFQDLEVQADTLRRFSQEMTKEGMAPPETLMAMGILIERLRQRQDQARTEFAARFHSFALPANRNTFKELFASPARESAQSTNSVTSLNASPRQ